VVPINDIDHAKHLKFHENDRMKHTATDSSSKKQTESFKETFESIVMAFILAFVFRAFIVEAFVIPTGSMAPTLMGQHADVTCPQCGYNFESDVPKTGIYKTPTVEEPYTATLTCPMCSYPIKIDALNQVRPGDRILVHKFIYNFSEPKRWDVVVFKNPAEPQANFIKRLVGLPDEKLFIIDGNIYTQPNAEPDSPWQIQRKTQREIVQRTVWQPVYHSAFYPLDEGASPDRENQWQFPWVADMPQSIKRVNRTWLQYDGSTPTRLDFDYKQLSTSQVNIFNKSVNNAIGWYPYNQLTGEKSNEPIEDIRIAIKVVPEPKADIAKQGVGLTFMTTGRTDGLIAVPIRAVIDQKGKITIATSSNESPDTWQQRATSQIQPLPLDRASLVEFWFVDQQVSLWVDGQRISTWEYDVPIQKLIQRPGAPIFPQTSVQIQGVAATITQLDLDRDLYYSSGPNPYRKALGVLYKTGSDRHGEPAMLQTDQFYCLGDNSPSSSDGRFWTDVNPWIEQRMLSDKKQVTGVVPRELMIGKAFFVYFPAPHRLTPTTMGIIPNFGDVRFIH
tara:strand:+ start:49513 stop:51195 length:1683 start_codon:yes stop_codon:yes gene_type:complete